MSSRNGERSKYYLGGSWASSVSGVPRQTNDADIAVDLPFSRVDELVKNLGASFYADAEDIRRAIRERSSSNLIHIATGFKVDLFARGRGPFDESEFDRRRLVQFGGGIRFFVESPEDTVIRKLMWYRDGGRVSDRQWSDVQGILRIQGEHLDRGYLRRWASGVGVAELLEQALLELGEKGD